MRPCLAPLRIASTKKTAVGARSRMPGSDDADEVVAELREMKINDFMTKDGQLREHARVMRDMYLEEVKSAA